jgi:hypothetical protein
MNNMAFIMGLGCAAVAASVAYAQADLPGEDRALPSNPASPQQRKAAGTARRAQGKTLGRQDFGRLEDTGAAAGGAPMAMEPTTKQERATARATRKAEGNQLSKEDWGRQEDSPTLP